MKTKKYLTATAVLIFCAGTAAAQNIRWNPIGPNAPPPMAPFDISPLRPANTIYNQVGPLTFDSDGSRGYSTGNQTIVTTPDGTTVPVTRLGETVYLRDANGNPVRCKKYGENVFCE